MVDNLFEQKFHDKFEYIAKEFDIPFSRLSDLLGLSKNSIYALRKSHNWKPQTEWFVDKSKRLDAVHNLLVQYREFAIFHSKGKIDKYDSALFHQWVFALWWNTVQQDARFITTPIPVAVKSDPYGPPKPPMTKEEKILAQAREVLSRHGNFLP
jgi:hypothetical protein